ncbi:LacI family DNA-binding transcriptional regulator [Fusobacterium sp.]|uniref:LacI family DNA-binding transcriptional regulator n=1 Tax=Fusobacterium sp. TaxID=68766 RepID=UPI001D41B4E8|nr:LacI family DNA-binding transcriptional regulator [Fusobacterium sp.]MBS5790002.1 LacI family DNA-binding transcriptional regulator [Fusobacterium sp.]
MVTLKNLSEITGYSIATISRVLNNDKTLRASEETKKIIKTVAKTSGYKTLQSKKNKQKIKSSLYNRCCLGIVEPSNIQEHIQDPYYLYLKGFVEQECFNKKIETVKIQYNTKSKKYNFFPNKKVDGIITIGHFSVKEIDDMKKITKNIVFLDCAPHDGNYSSVIVDLKLGLKRGVDYLISCGHKNICFAGPKTAPNIFKELELEIKRVAFLEYIKEKNISENCSLLECERSTESAHENTKLFIEKNIKNLPTVFLAVNESVALGILNALKEKNIKVPEEISVLSYNNTIFSAFITPPLSSISIDSEYMAQTAVELTVKQAKTKLFRPVQILTFPYITEKQSIKKLNKF